MVKISGNSNNIPPSGGGKTNKALSSELKGGIEKLNGLTASGKLFNTVAIWPLCAKKTSMKNINVKVSLPAAAKKVAKQITTVTKNKFAAPAA